MPAKNSPASISATNGLAITSWQTTRNFSRNVIGIVPDFWLTGRGELVFRTKVPLAQVTDVACRPFSDNRVEPSQLVYAKPLSLTSIS